MPKEPPVKRGKLLFLIASREDACVPYQWVLKIIEKGVQADVLTLSDVGGSKWRFILSVINLLRVNRYRAVHINHTFPVLMATLLRVLSPRSKLIVSYHRDFKYLDVISKIAHFVGSFISDVSIANSYATLESIPEFLKKKRDFQVVYNGVDASDIAFFPRREASEKDFSIVCVARFIEEKNHRQLVRAFSSLLKNKSPHPMKLYLVGGGPYFEEIKKLVEELDLREAVHMTGMLPRSEVYEVLHKADLFIMASVTEGFCNAVVEAMMAGVPIIYTPVGALPEVVGDTGIRAVGTDASDLESALNYFLETSDVDRLRMAEKAKDRATELFSMDSSVCRFLEIYKL